MGKVLKRCFLPSEERYRRITIALYVLYAASLVPLYFLALSMEFLLPAVRWMWRLNIFGVWRDTLPYYCEHYEGNAFITGQCDFATTTRGRPTLPSGAEISLLYLVMFALGGFISIRIATICLQKVEEALGINIVSRLLDFFIPGKSS